MARDAFELIRWAREVRGLKAPQKCVLMVLASYADKKGECWPSLAALTDDTGLGRSTLCRALDTLEAGDLIEREARYRREGNGGRTSTLYRIRT